MRSSVWCTLHKWLTADGVRDDAFAFACSICLLLARRNVSDSPASGKAHYPVQYSKATDGSYSNKTTKA
eukprot:6174852-Pleurochrysis_carterae.AAC.2